MTVERLLGRRLFITRLTRTTLGVAVMGSLAACATGEGATSGDGASAGGASAGGKSAGGTSTGSEQSSSPATPPSSGGTDAVDWHRVNLGFVSAYVLVRAGEAAVVDTGVEGSADDIEQALAAAGLDWAAVGHVILTHKHPDHVGSVADVLERAADATPYAGHADIPAIDAPREVRAVADDDEVFGLQVITTPGHTPGHISVLDRASGLLVAGDALTGARGGGGVARPNAQFTEDMDTANKSIRKLAGFTFETAVFGHGEPLESGADVEVAELAGTL
jgi:glyoxylase-like metal-dependent hydrolase (beta-lactamase superfamily II)